MSIVSAVCKVFPHTIIFIFLCNKVAINHAQRSLDNSLCVPGASQGLLFSLVRSKFFGCSSHHNVDILKWCTIAMPRRYAYPIGNARFMQENVGVNHGSRAMEHYLQLVVLFSSIRVPCRSLRPRSNEKKQLCHQKEQNAFLASAALAAKCPLARVLFLW